MQTPDSIEAALARLMPPALSEAGQRSLEAMLDELASTAPAPAARHFFKFRPAVVAIPLGIAAALLAWLSLAPGDPSPAPPSPGPRIAALPVAAAPATAEPGSGLVLVSESDRIETVTDGGWLGDPDGAAMAAVRLRVVEATTFRDEESGIVVQVSDPRDEVILTPVSAF
jgi:hypothetical protein